MPIPRSYSSFPRFRKRYQFPGIFLQVVFTIVFLLYVSRSLTFQLNTNSVHFIFVFVLFKNIPVKSSFLMSSLILFFHTFRFDRPFLFTYIKNCKKYLITFKEPAPKVTPIRVKFLPVIPPPLLSYIIPIQL